MIFLAFLFIAAMLYSVIAHSIFRWLENGPEYKDTGTEMPPEFWIALLWPVTSIFYVIFLWPRKLVLKIENRLAARRERKHVDSGVYR
jgi:uncharacterized BrkB/YihY/UPF0761 family membrane protein